MSFRSVGAGATLFKKVCAVFERTNAYLSVVSAFAIVLAMFAILVDVAGRLLRIPILGVHELNALLIGMCIYLGIGFVQGKKRNITVTLLTDRLPARAAAILDVLMLMICAAFFAWTSRLYYEAAKSALAIHEVAEGVSGFPMFPLKLIMFLGILILTIQLVIDIINRFLQIFNVPVSEETT